MKKGNTMQKTNLLNQLSNYVPENNEIKVNIYSGYNFIHIDLLSGDTELIWTTVAVSDEKETNPLELKICAIDESFKMSKENMKYFKELINIINTYDISCIHGRVTTPKKYKKFEALFEELGFSFVICTDKEYPTAKIKYTK